MVKHEWIEFVANNKRFRSNGVYVEELINRHTWYRFGFSLRDVRDFGEEPGVGQAFYAEIAQAYDACITPKHPVDIY